MYLYWCGLKCIETTQDKMLIIVWGVKTDSTVLTSLHVQTRYAQLGESPTSVSSLLWYTMRGKLSLYKKSSKATSSSHTFSHPHMHACTYKFKNIRTHACLHACSGWLCVMPACMHINMPTPYPNSACVFSVGGKQLCCLQYVYIMYILFTWCIQ